MLPETSRFYGRRLAFESLDDTGRFTLYLARAHGIALRALTSWAAPSWRP